MFNLKYNILAMYQMVLGLLSSVLMLRVFGVTIQADSYLIACSIITSLQFVQIMFVEQFMFFYNDLKVQDRESARVFYNTAVTFSIFSGIFFYIVFALSVHPLIKMFAFGIDAERYRLLENILQILFMSTIFESVNLINQRLLNAEMQFSVPYILSSFQPLFTVLLLVYLTVTGNPDIELIAGARTFGAFFACLAGFVVLGRMGFPFCCSLRHPTMKPFVINSLAMRFGCNIHNILLNPITNNILALLPSGIASCFYYAQRLHQVVNNVVVGPGYAVFHSRVSRQWSELNLAGIKTDIRKFLPSASAFFLIAATLMYFLIPTVLGMVGSRDLLSGDVELIQHLFLALAPWYLVALVESPFLSVCIASKRSAVFIASNTLFIVSYFLFSFFLARKFGVYTIPIGMTTAQIINLASFMIFCLSLLKENKKPIDHNLVKRGRDDKKR